MTRLFIFDWDGTVIDSTGKIVRCMQLAMEREKLPVLEHEAIVQIIGLGLPEAISTLYPGLEADRVEGMREAYSHYFIDADQTPCSFYPGVQETLDALKARGDLLAVATGKSRRGLNRVLGSLGMEDFFHATRCADETASKPDPLMLQQLLDELDVAVDRAVMIGDTSFDLAMAEALGMDRVAVSYGAHPVERLETHSPVAVMDDLRGLLSL